MGTVDDGAAPAAESPPEAAADVHEERHKHKEKKHKKEKKSKHKRHKEKSHRRDRSPSGSAEAGDSAGEERRGDEAPAAAAAPDLPAAAAAVSAPGSPAAAGAAEPAATAPAAAAAGPAAAEDAEEGELEERLEERAERRRHGSRSRSRDGSRERHRRSRSRGGRTRSQSPADHALHHDTSRATSELQRSQRDRSPAGAGRDRPRSRSPPRRRRSSSRSPDRRLAGGRPRSRSPPRRHDSRDRAPLPPRGGYRPDLDRRGGYDRRPDSGRGRYGGPGEPGVRFEDRRRFDEGRRRSRSRSRDGRKRSRSRSGERRRHQKEDEEDDEEFQRRVAAALEQQQGDDEDRMIEERRRRRQEILAKHRSQQDLSAMAAAPTATAQQQQAAAEAAAAGGSAQQEAQAAAQPAAAAAEAAAQPSQRARPVSANGEGAAAAAGDEGEPEELSDNEEAVVAQLGTTHAGALDIFRHDGSGAGACGGGPESAAPSEMPPQSGVGEAVDTELDKRLGARVAAEPDMFGSESDADDIFAATPQDVKEKEAAAQAAPAAGPARKGLLDNYDDAEGYYNFQVGEVIGEAGGPQYEVYAAHGRGVFSSVLRARDLARRNCDTGTCPEVAIKVIRANETMYKAGQVERVILRKLSEADPEGKRHVIRMLGSFEYRHHLCLVFEAMDMNLRELTKRYGRGIGLSISAVRVYAQQMLVALYHLRNCGVLHADIKPDNILVNDRRTVVKLCDFGSAMFSGDNEITPYLVSRFYRAPEVILGLPYEYPMDMWSIGCVVYELFTGRILFPGKTNNEMLKLMMDAKGPFPKKMVKRAEFAVKHFEADPNLSFALIEEDPVTKRPARRLIPNPTIKKDFGALLAGQSPDRRKLAQLVDLLERMMQLDPDKRITPKEALRHPFIKEPQSAPK